MWQGMVCGKRVLKAWLATINKHNLYSLKRVDVPIGLTSSGYAQVNLELKANQTYYTTIRAVTNSGNVLQTSSDGFTVDQTPPVIQVDR